MYRHKFMAGYLKNNNELKLEALDGKYYKDKQLSPKNR